LFGREVRECEVEDDEDEGLETEGHPVYISPVDEIGYCSSKDSCEKETEKEPKLGGEMDRGVPA
jgi:hypothetical protein